MKSFDFPPKIELSCFIYLFPSVVPGLLLILVPALHLFPVLRVLLPSARVTVLQGRARTHRLLPGKTDSDRPAPDNLSATFL